MRKLRKAGSSTGAVVRAMTHAHHVHYLLFGDGATFKLGRSIT